MSDTSVSDSEEIHVPVKRVTRRKTISKTARALEELRQNKNLGLTRAQEYALGEKDDDKLYDVLDDEQYEALKRKRKEQGAFVVDDDGTGYVDNYEEDHYFNYKEDIPGKAHDHEDQPNHDKKKKRKIGNFKVADSGGSGNISMLFSKIKRANFHTKERITALSKEEKAERELEAMLEDELEDEIKTSNGDHDENTDNVENEILFATAPESVQLETPDVDEKQTKEEFLKALKERPLKGLVPVVSPTKKIEEVSKVALSKNISPTVGSPPLRKKTKSMFKELLFEVCSSCGKGRACNCQNSQTSQVINFFFLDLFEDRFACPGSVFLFGKALINNDQGNGPSSNETYETICVQVQGLYHKLYFLPRKGATSDQIQSDIDESLNDFLKPKSDIGRISRVKVQRNFCFEHQMPEDSPLPNGDYEVWEVEVPANKINYRVKDLSPGANTLKIFNVQQSQTEALILDCALKGPGWLHLKNAKEVSGNLSWCNTMLSVNGAEAVKVTSSAKEPFLNVLSLNIKTIVNEKTHVNEIVSIGCSVVTNYSIEKKLWQESKVVFFSIIRDPSSIQSLSKDKAIALKNQILGGGARGKIYMQQNEKSVLNLFLAKMQQYDPDIVVSHGLLSFDVSVLLNRLNSNNVPNWSRLFRLRKNTFPSSRQRPQLIGRLSVDVEISAKELLIGQNNYSLKHLSKTLISSIGFEGVEGESFVDIDVAKDHVAKIEKENEVLLKCTDALGVILLTKNVSNLCGNVWNRTLCAGRSERIEYLLLHELQRKAMIFPEKVKRNGGAKDKFAGGLVLDPKSGLYDKNIILLLDYNSLYPSIIQEYNLCFSNANKEPEEMALEEQRIYPSVLETLVRRRNEVKRLIKTQSKEGKNIEVLDIRQKALKIIANSMYGCLGFQGSRFYTQKVAERVTAKGRELLMSAVETVETQFGLNVVYGDTDSIMIKTNISNRVLDSEGKINEELLKKVKNLSRDIRKQVNDMYKVVELGEDGMFMSLLLLKKKKYAALSLQNGKLKKEVKGLDMVRRDWCLLTKKISNKILDIVLNRNEIISRVNEGEEVNADVQDNIIQVMTDLKQEIEGDKGSFSEWETLDIKQKKRILNKYTITKGLNKKVEEYKGTLAPHVQVAKRLLQNGKKKIKVGDHIPYVMMKKVSSESNASKEESLPMHPDEILFPEKGVDDLILVDSRFYIDQQLLPPVERLLGVIEEINLSQIYDLFGVKKHLQGTLYEDDEEAALLDDPALRRERKFRDTIFKMPCPSCSKTVHLSSVSRKCNSCSKEIPSEKLRIRLVLKARELIKAYYGNEIVLKDKNAKCKNVGVLGESLLLDNTGSKAWEVSRSMTEESLLHQLQFYEYLLGDESMIFSQRFVKRNRYNFVSTSIFRSAFGLSKKRVKNRK